MHRLTLLAGCGLASILLAGCDGRGSILRKDAADMPSASQMIDGQPAFVGRWAAAAGDCATTAWTMTAEQLQSPGAMACRVANLSPTMAGYTVNAGCSDGGGETPGRVVMTLIGAPPASGMTLSGGPFAEPVSLVRCPA